MSSCVNLPCARISPMTLLTAGAFAVFTAMLWTTPAAAADRLSDKDVKALIERIDNERDRFEDQLDGEVKRSILRGPGGEVHVERYLDDLQENIKKLKERFSSEYAASAEATAVLRQGADISRFMTTKPPNMDGASEWNRLAASLSQLAAVYGTSMPLPEGHVARRVNDHEVKVATTQVAKDADRFKKELDASLKYDTSVDKPTREAAVRGVEDLKADARRLGSLAGDGRPASGEAKALLDRAAAIRGAIGGRTLSPPARTAWAQIETSLDKVALAFGLPGRGQP
jgi:hypothetical protein